MDLIGDVSWKLLFVLCTLGLVMHSGETWRLQDIYTQDTFQQPNPTIIEGDILADKDLLRMIGRSKGIRQKRGVHKINIRLWDNGLIPYSISHDVSDNFRKVVRRAFRRLAAKTCIHFIPKRTTDKYYIHFKQGKGCYSSVGRQDGGQVISLGTTCETQYRALHEIMHALGFLHEHSRPDRDDFVKILHWNIEDGAFKNFNSYSPMDVDTLSKPYDFDSILHYDNKAFSKNGQDTIQALNDSNRRFGHAKSLSSGDVRQIRKLYKCDRRRAKLNGSNSTYTCENKIPGCNSYADGNDACESNYEFMNMLCQQTCGFCSYG